MRNGGGGGGDRTMSGAVDVFSMYMSSLEVCIRLEMSIIYCHQLLTSDISYSTDYSYYPVVAHIYKGPLYGLFSQPAIFYRISC